MQVKSWRSNLGHRPQLIDYGLLDLASVVEVRGINPTNHQDAFNLFLPLVIVRLQFGVAFINIPHFQNGDTQLFRVNQNRLELIRRSVIRIPRDFIPLDIFIGRINVSKSATTQR